MKIKNKKVHKKEKLDQTSKKYLKIIKPVFWFFVGVAFASLCIVTVLLVYFKITYKDKVIPGVFIGDVYVGEKTPQEIETYFEEKNEIINNTLITFTSPHGIATVSAQTLNIGYNEKLIADQAASVGNSKDLISNAYHIINSYLNGTFLPPSFRTETEKVEKELSLIQKEVYKEPVDALFKVESNRVVAFKQSSNGATIDFKLLHERVEKKVPAIVVGEKNITVVIPIKTLKPRITTEKANNLGIVEVIGVGSSSFAHSIPNRIHNVALAASRINGVLVAPGETFSFVKNLGDVSRYTGYKEAYVIENGKTVLGDGGGVCQVSTTLFRAILNAGLAITERSAHAYRVAYYEQDSSPGLDATVYVPSVDFKFKNDTSNYMFIQEAIDLQNLTLTFTIYGKRDGRTVSVTKPVVTSQSPAPEPTYQDDPNLPKGVTKQVDFAAAGANVVFTRTITKDGKSNTETYKSNYRPWRAVFLRGTKEG